MEAGTKPCQSAELIVEESNRGFEMSDLLKHFTKSDSQDHVVQALLADGAIIIENVIQAHEVTALNEKFQPALDEERMAQTGRADLGGLMPGTMVFATNLPSRYPEISKYFNDPFIVEVAARGLSTSFADITINTTQVMEAHPGNPEQPLHRDDATWKVPTPRPDLCIVTLWALQNFTREAGGTRFLPRSHLHPEASQLGKYDENGVPLLSYDDIPTEVPQVEMAPGSVLVFQGKLLHGGGANRTTDQIRRYMHIGYCHAWLRQVENQCATITPEQALEFDKDVQHLLGFDMYSFELGHAYNLSPIEYFKREKEKTAS
jgi:ectoine hydroxylase-related dioxygenase (phytanoyl-CoA dioxygenase family)